MSLPPIVAKVTADTSGLVKGLADSEKRLATFAKAAGAATAAVVVGLVALTKASLANIDVLAKQARSLGLSVAAFQKMSLVAEEAGVEAGKLTSMLGLMQRNIVELQSGTAKQTQAFAALGLSISDLQGLAPDEQFARIAEKLDGIADPAQKTALAMEVFGRSGREAINMLSGYGAAVENAAQFQAAFGITVGQETSDNVERANDAVGRLGMIFQGLGNTLAGIVAPAIEGTANGLIWLAESLVGARTEVEQFFGSLEEAKQALGEDLFNKLMGDPQAVVDATYELNELGQGIADMQRLAMEAGAEIGLLHQSMAQLGPVGQSALDGILMSMEEVRRQFVEGEITAQDFLEKMEDLRTRALALAQELDGVNGANFGPAISALSSLGEAIRARLGEAAALRDALNGGGGMTEGTGLSSSDNVATLMPPGSGSVSTSKRPGVRPVDWVGGEPENLGTGGGGGGGGGGGLANQLAARLETLREGLATEAEVVAEWYATSQQTLEEALAAKMLTEAEYMEARERLEEEHQSRLQGIRDMGNQWSLSAALKGGAEILGAMGSSNKKIIKAQKVFAAASALIDTYQGAAAELKKGTFGFASAAAVIAKGVAFIAAIKGAGDGASGGGSGGGGSTSAAASSSPPVQRVMIDYNGPASAFNSFSGLVDMINAAGKAGYVLNAEIMGAR